MRAAALIIFTPLVCGPTRCVADYGLQVLRTRTPVEGLTSGGCVTGLDVMVAARGYRSTGTAVLRRRTIVWCESSVSKSHMQPFAPHIACIPNRSIEGLLYPFFVHFLSQGHPPLYALPLSSSSFLPPRSLFIALASFPSFSFFSFSFPQSAV
jgi:hypothetical protein